MKTATKFETLTAKTRSAMRAATVALADPKNGIAALAATQDVASLLSWNVESWMKASHKLQLAAWIADGLANSARTAWGAVNFDGQDGSEEYRELALNTLLDSQAATLARQFSRTLMEIVYRGAEGSSNPMRIVESSARVSAAREVLENVLDLMQHEFLSSDTFGAIFDVKDAKEEERRIAQSRQVRKLVYFKNTHGCYECHAINSDGKSIAQHVFTGVTKKGDALTEVAHIQLKLRNEGQMQTILVEYAP